MAPGKLCSRKGKAETAEVCSIYILNQNFIYQRIHVLFERFYLNVVARGLLRFPCTAENCAIVCGFRVTTRRFSPSASLPLFYVLCLQWTGLFPNHMKTEQDSLVFVKRMMAVAVSSITYLRGIFPEEAYRSRYLEGETATASCQYSE